jgi:DNA-directed RNA polymerase subunit RPC12/RpoP
MMVMIGELVCPDCGGVVGATETTEAGPPCRCFVPPPADASDTVADSPPVEQVPVAKVCRICGKDLTGKKRIKDRTGYWCSDCVKEDEKQLHGGRVRCRSCGHLVKEENLTLYEGTRMCPTCYQERINLKKQQIKRMGIKAARTRAELQRIWGLVAILVVLGLFIAYGVYRMARH